jgi:phosphoglycolate phosphatase-like HAD superfamily hydrolase
VNLKTKAILFDFDLTLVDSSWGITHCLNLLATEQGLRPLSREEVLVTIGEPIAVAWERLWGHYDPRWVESYRERYRQEEISRVRPFPSTGPVLEALKEGGFRLGVVSNRGNAKLAVEGAGLGWAFEIVFGLEDVDRPKPAPDPLLKAMDSLGVDGEGVLYVGDTDIDMATAVAASVKGVGMTTGNFDRSGLIEAGAWTVLDDLAELCPLVGLPFPCGARL